VFVAIQLNIFEPKHNATLYEFIVVNGQTIASEFHKVV